MLRATQDWLRIVLQSENDQVNARNWEKYANLLCPIIHQWSRDALKSCGVTEMHLLKQVLYEQETAPNNSCLPE